MTTYTYVGAALPNYKSVQVSPGANAGPNALISIGLGPYQITRTGWDATALATAWNASQNGLISQITASANGSNLVLTCNIQGLDFEITCTINGITIGQGGSGGNISTLMTLVIVASGGTFTVSDGTYTSGNISYSSTPATLASNIQTAIAAMTGYGSTDVEVTWNASGYFVLDFSHGRFSGLSVTGWSVAGGSLTGGTALATITETQAGNTGTSEVITVSFPGNGTSTQVINAEQELQTTANNGTFSIAISGYGTTPVIQFNAGRTAITQALEDILGLGNVQVTGGPLFYPQNSTHYPIYVTFIGALAGIAIPTMTVNIISGGINEVQEIVLTGTPITGTFDLSFGGHTTVSLQNTATAAQVQSALQALSSIGNGNISITGGPLITPILVGQQDEIQSITGSGNSSSISPANANSTDTFTISFSGHTTGPIAVTASLATIQAALQSLSSIGSGNISVTGSPLVVQTGPTSGQSEIQTVTPSGGITSGSSTAAGDTFTITVNGQTTVPILATSSASTIQTAVQLLSSVGSGNMTVAGGPLLTQTGPTSGQNEIQQMAFVQGSLNNVLTFTVKWNGNTASVFNGSLPATYSDFQTDFQNAFLSLPGCSGNLSFAWGTGSVLGGDPDTVDLGFAVNVTYTNSLGDASHPEFQIIVQQPGGFTTYTAYDSGGSQDGALANPQAGQSAAYSFTYAAITLTFTGALADTPQALVVVNTSGCTVTGFTGAVSETQHGAYGFYNYTYGEVFLTFIGSLANSSQVLVTTTPTASATSFIGTVAEVQAGSAGTWEFSYNSMIATFIGTLGNAAQSLITATTLTGSGTITVSELVQGDTATYTVTVVQTGGSQTVQNITGGTWSLSLLDPTTAQTYNVNGIPYNVTSSGLQTLINAVCGSGACTVTGGPAPGTPLVITFAGPMGSRTLTVTIVPSLTGNFGASSNLTTVRSSINLPIPQNVYDLTVIPGEGTLAVTDGAPLTSLGYIILNILEPSSTIPTYIVNNAVYIPLQGINPTQIENAINESLGQDSVRVTRVIHSLEHGTLPANAGYGVPNNAAQDLFFWYFKDVFRLVFCNAYQAASSIASMSVSFPLVNGVQTGPVNWMSPSSAPPASADTQDFYQESERTYVGFTAYETFGAPPIHQLGITQNTDVQQPILTYRAKLLSQYAPGQLDPFAVEVSAQTVARAGQAKQFPDNQVIFQWVQNAVGTADNFTGPTVIASAASLNWDASADEIQAALVPIFGAGNVVVTGTLYNSWLSEGQADSPFAVSTYHDVHIALTGALAGLQLSDMGYTLKATISSTAQGVAPFLWMEEFSKPLPGGLNQRNRFWFNTPASVSSLTLTVNNITISGLTTATTAGQLQEAINTALGQLTPGYFPQKWSQALTVYGTTLAAPVDFEWSGNGHQYTVNTMNIGVIGITTLVTDVVNTPGVYPVKEIQNLVISGSPHGGTYTVNGSGNIAYNAIASAIQSAVGSAPPTVAGTYPTFTLTWPASSGHVALWATTSALNNSSVVLNQSNATGTQQGGPGAAVAISDLVVGIGPSYYDCPTNFSPNGVPGSGDTLIIDDATEPILYGIAQTSNFIVASITPSVFQHVRNRQVFQNGQKVTLSGTGTPPAGLTFGNSYYIISQTNTYTFQLSTTQGGSAVTVTTTGSGSFWLATKGIVLDLYNRYSGQTIGLPNTNSSASMPEYLPKYLQLSGVTAEIGLSSGNGINNLRLDTWNDPSNVTIIYSGGSDVDNVSAVLLLFNNAASDLSVTDGDVAIAFYSNETSTLNSITVNGGDLSLNNVVAALLQSATGVPVLMTNCNIADVISLG